MRLDRATSRIRAFTLVEATLVVVIIGIVGAVTMPVIVGAGDAYAASAASRRAADKGAFAMERIIRLLRDAPAGAVNGSVDIVSATANLIRFSDGRGLELSGSTLRLRATDGSLSNLCDNVTVFVINYRGSDGITDTMATPTATQRFDITLVANGFELRLPLWRA